MKLFACSVCEQPLFFENVQCGHRRRNRGGTAAGPASRMERATAMSAERQGCVRISTRGKRDRWITSGQAYSRAVLRPALRIASSCSGELRSWP